MRALKEGVRFASPNGGVRTEAREIVLEDTVRPCSSSRSKVPQAESVDSRCDGWVWAVRCQFLGCGAAPGSSPSRSPTPMLPTSDRPAVRRQRAAVLIASHGRIRAGTSPHVDGLTPDPSHPRRAIGSMIPERFTTSMRLGRCPISAEFRQFGRSFRCLDWFTPVVQTVRLRSHHG